MNTREHLLHVTIFVLVASAFMAYVVWNTIPEVIILALSPLIGWLVYLLGRKMRGDIPFRSLSLPIFFVAETLALAMFVFALYVLAAHDFPMWSYIVLLVLFIDLSYILFKEYRAGLPPAKRSDVAAPG
ncbi:hypothetical protein SAMN04488087_1774 [Rhodothermus profundi]|uniref:DUF2568 domain-containing protein n=2 Tax=Rhodothermus profundi TaxID=633813 RepID=A0A1M6UMI4_9BACT|nr:hypothetical protein SAMN04488087_1774 [Rhodothermus profundi]